MKKFKSYIAGVLTGALIMSVPALAESVKEMVEVYFNTITVTVDGTKVEADNILYNDRTYVPLRAIAEMTGKTVDWDDTTKTADIHDAYGITYTGEVVGNVNGKSITSEQLELYKSLVKIDNAEIAEEELDLKAKERIIYDIALEDYAKEFGIEINADFDAQYDAYLQYLNAQYPQYMQIMEMVGFTEKSYKQSWQSDYLTQLIISEAQASYAASDAEIEEYYNTNKEEFKYDGVQAKHILLSTVDSAGNPVSDEQKSEVKKKADELYAKIKNGEDFDALMTEHGEDPGVASNPDGYIFTKGEMVAEFEEAAYALEVGQVSEPVLSSYGYHIIKLIAKHEYMPLDSVKDEIKNIIETTKLEDAVNKRSAAYTATWN